MSLPFFEYSAQRLGVIVKPDMLCAFDFDGTLAPTVKDPERARIPTAVLRRLIVLSKHARVAIITERSVEDVRMHLDFTPDFVIGNHGIEGLPGGENRTDFHQQLCHAWEQHLGTALRALGAIGPGVTLENKAHSVAVHFRKARDPDAAKRGLTELFATLLPQAHVIAGEYAFHLLPPDAGNKGAALAALCVASGASSACYVGDDVSDEDVFQLCREDWLTVCINKAPHSAAEFHLAHRLDMVQLLDVLIQKLTDAQFAKSAVVPITGRHRALRSV